uniref:Uncharacterized protein n=1 Tax=Nelumbo nucifera TaxID=4432 RepID=A0A822YGQ7_NELNU|nr:TPA_asm: hypothetical protein HUJ06_012225 [Nelumbo nucifera]
MVGVAGCFYVVIFYQDARYMLEQLVIFYICLMVGVDGTSFGSKKQLYLH